MTISVSHTTPRYATRRLKRDRCAVDVCILPDRAKGQHALWMRLTGQECNGAGQCGLSTSLFPDVEASLAAKRADRAGR
ncbi:hypothetical protein GCM10009817_06640 [Terrabacter lapilli]|uniref:Uncharacterized protein n=1 Tax=Terrabacter lapilli TaxID=436231 RepID=A0ABN2RHT7_9MICO